MFHSTRTRPPGQRKPALLVHTTPRARLRSILAHGLLPCFARSSAKRVWLHCPSLRRWAEDHVKDRHGCDSVVTLEIAIDRRQLRRHARRGVWYYTGRIAPEQIVSVNGLRLLAVA